MDSAAARPWARPDELLRLNPAGEVPVLLDGATVVCDSRAITDYLEEAYPEPGLLGRSQAERNEVRRRYSDREPQTLCQMFGSLDRGYRSYAIADQWLKSDELRRPPSSETLWAWRCAYPRPYGSIVESVERRYQLPESLVYAVMRQESAFRPNVVSPAGAVGLMQVMPLWKKALTLDPQSQFALDGKSYCEAQLKSAVEGESDAAPETEESPTPTLDEQGRDLSALAVAGRLGPIIGRQKEIRAVLKTLVRRQKANPLLLGDPGEVIRPARAEPVVGGGSEVAGRRVAEGAGGGERRPAAHQRYGVRVHNSLVSLRSTTVGVPSSWTISTGPGNPRSSTAPFGTAVMPSGSRSRCIVGISTSYCLARSQSRAAMLTADPM